jgi:flagellin
MPVINTNTNAAYAQDALKVNTKVMSTAMQQLATGNRINQARDDAAGLSIGQNMTSQVRGLNQAARNLNDGINLLQTADGALVETSNMLQRMRELAVQSANATNSSSQRIYLNREFTSLTDEITRIANNTQWNNASVFGTSALANTMIFQAGINSGQTISVVISAMDAGSLLIASAAITGYTSASAAIGLLDTAIDAVNSSRSTMGATMNQLSYSADNFTNISTNIAASRSSIMDTDYAMASSQLSRTQIIQQAATAMLAQANQQPQMVLELLK